MNKQLCTTAIALLLPLSLFADGRSANKVGMVENAVRISNVENVKGFFGEHMKLNRDVYLKNFPIDKYVNIVSERKQTAWDWTKAEQALNIRIPAWCENPSVSINGKAVDGVKAGKYCSLKRSWKAGDKIEVNLRMKLQWVKREHHADYEKYYLKDGEIMYREHPTKNIPYALMRGPVVYCVDMVWNPQIGNDDVDIKNNMAFDTSVLPEPVALPDSSFLGPCYKANAVYMGKPVTLTMTPFCSIGQWWRNGEEKVAGWANAYSYAIWLSKK